MSSGKKMFCKKRKKGKRENYTDATAKTYMCISTSQKRTTLATKPEPDFRDSDSRKLNIGPVCKKKELVGGIYDI